MLRISKHIKSLLLLLVFLVMGGCNSVPIPTEPPQMTYDHLPIKYYTYCSCDDNQIFATLILEPLGGIAPYTISHIGEVSGTSFVDNFTFTDIIGDTINIRIESADIPPLIWEDDITFDCYQKPDYCNPVTELPIATPTRIPDLEVTWDIVEKCAINELEITLEISGGQSPYVISPASKFTFSINEAQEITVETADGQKWKTILDPTKFNYCGSAGDVCNEVQVCKDVQICKDVEVCRDVCVKQTGNGEKCIEWETQCSIENKCSIENQCSIECK